jgi:hypothetical protein
VLEEIEEEYFIENNEFNQEAMNDQNKILESGANGRKFIFF